MYNATRSQLRPRRKETTSCQHFPEPQKTTYTQCVHLLGPKSHYFVISYSGNTTGTQRQDIVIVSICKIGWIATSANVLMKHNRFFHSQFLV